MVVLEWMRDGIAAELIREAETLDSEDTGAEESYRRTLHSTMLHVTPAQARELSEFVQDAILRWFRLNRAEDGTELAGDPDSEDDPVDYRVLFAMRSEERRVGKECGGGGRRAWEGQKTR